MPPPTPDRRNLLLGREKRPFELERGKSVLVDHFGCLGDDAGRVERRAPVIRLAAWMPRPL